MFFKLENRTESWYVFLNGRGLSPLPHLHSHIEIVLVHSGESVAVADSQQVTLRGGDLFISFPNQIHYYMDKTREVNHSILIVSDEMCPEFSKEFKTLIPEIPLYEGAGNNSKIVSAFETIYDCRKSGGKYNDVEVRGCMLLLLSEIFRNMPLIENPSCDTTITKSIINYCYENYNTDISLLSVAEALHVSRYYVSRLFSSRLHVSFSDYINSLRIQKACELFKRGETNVTEVAITVGYNSIRCFDRSFKQIKGMTPREYKANIERKMLSKK